MVSLRKCYHKLRTLPYSLHHRRVIRRYDKTRHNICHLTGLPLKSDTDGVIVSFTSYGGRINTALYAAESILRQTLKPSRLILWLSEEEFPDDSTLPPSLLRLVPSGLEIKRCPDWRSYKKLVPTVLSCPDRVIVTIDDDTVYPSFFLERLWKAYFKNPESVHFYRGHTMHFHPDGSPTAYTSWMKTPAKGCSMYNFPTGVGGILYPPGTFTTDVLNPDSFMDIAPTADDVWFRAITFAAGIPCNKVPCGNFEWNFSRISTSGTAALETFNVHGGENDRQILRTFRHMRIC